MPKDACYRKVKAKYKVFPSARASQAIAKCRKASGTVKKSKSGTELKRWEKEKWVDTRTGKPVVLVVRTSIADLPSVFRARHLRQRVKCQVRNSQERRGRRVRLEWVNE
jgi:hypothetical protein